MGNNSAQPTSQDVLGGLDPNSCAAPCEIHQLKAADRALDGRLQTSCKRANSATVPATRPGPVLGMRRLPRQGLPRVAAQAQRDPQPVQPVRLRWAELRRDSSSAPPPAAAW
ncbi:acetyl esterase [Apiospora arundinis]